MGAFWQGGGFDWTPSATLPAYLAICRIGFAAGV